MSVDREEIYAAWRDGTLPEWQFIVLLDIVDALRVVAAWDSYAAEKHGRVGVREFARGALARFDAGAESHDACGACGHPHVNGRSGTCSKFTCACRTWTAARLDAGDKT